MAQRVRDILLRIKGDASDAERELKEVATELKKFDQAEYEATLDVDTTAADLKMEAAQNAVDEYDRTVAEARIDLQTAGAEAQLRRLEQNLQNLQARASEPKIDIAIAKTIGQIEKVEAQLDRLDRKRVDVEVDVDVDRDRVGGLLAGGVKGLVGTIGGAISGAAEGLGLFVAAASKGIPVIGGLGGLLVQMGLSGAALGPIFLAAAAALSLAMIPAMVLAGGAVVALGASFVSAAAGVGVLGIALAAMFGPVFLVGVAAMARLPNIMKAVTAEAGALDKALKDLSPAERSLALALRELKDAAGEIFKPATNAIFRGMASAVEDIADFAKDKQVKAGFKAIGDAIGDTFKAFGAELRRPATRQAFANFANAAARAIRRLSPVFTGLFNLVMKIADVAMPWLEQVIKDVGAAIRGWLDDTRTSGIERFVRRVKNSFNAWKGVVNELWLIVKEFFGSAKDSGDKLADTIRKILRRFRNWLDENPEAVKQFFLDAKTFAQNLLTVVEDVASAIDDVVAAAKLGKDAIDTLVDAYEKIPGQKERGRVPKRLRPFPFNLIPFASGGPVFGGDTVPAMLTPGEFVLKRSVAQAIGVPRLNLLNAGNLAAVGGGRGLTIENQTVVLPPAPGHSQMGDPRHQAAQFARELRRRGEIGLSGGGLP